MNQGSNKQAGALILTFIWPFAGLVYTLSNWRQWWAKNAFWLACIYIGAVFIYWPEGTILGVGADGGRYVVRLMQMYNSDITLPKLLSGYLVDQHTMDLYQPLMLYLVSRFTDNGHVLFAAYAFVFGYFYSRNIWYVLEKLPDKKMGKFFILITLYFLVCPITQINGVRMWTALHVFVYAVMPYLLERDKSKLWLVLLAPLIHFSFLYVTIFALVYYLLPIRLKTRSMPFLTLAFLFFIVTLFINTLNLDATAGMLEELSPEAYGQRIDGYVNEDVLERRNDAMALNNWYVAGSANILSWCYNILLIVMFPCLKRHFREDCGIRNLYVFTLWLAGFANIMALIPSGGRFQLLAQMFKVPLILLVVTQIPKGEAFYKWTSVALVLLLIPFVFEIRKQLDYYSYTLLIGNFITVFLMENNFPIIEFIKYYLL